MTERQKYEKWLSDLEAKKDSTPQAVFDRVRADYSARLQEVVDALRSHTTSMQEHARTLMVRLKELEIAEEELREEIAENELRSQVGELSEGEWELQKKKADRMLGKFKDDQEVVAADLNKIREILSGATVDEEAAPRRSTDFDELEFLKSVVGPTTAASATPPTAPRQSSQTKAAAAPPSPAPSPPAATAPAPKPEPIVETPASEQPMQGKAPPPKSAPKLGRSEQTSIINNTDVSEQPKTLKCKECGAMNYASEWYCERCGAELAVV
jgi:hypothetical protein